MVTQTKSIDRKAEETETVSAVERMLSGIRLANPSVELRRNLSTGFVRLLVAFDAWLSEPAMTNRDRLRYDTTEHQKAMYLLWL